MNRRLSCNCNERSGEVRPVAPTPPAILLAVADPLGLHFHRHAHFAAGRGRMHKAPLPHIDPGVRGAAAPAKHHQVTGAQLAAVNHLAPAAEGAGEGDPAAGGGACLGAVSAPAPPA